jgi:hypothetical protein
MWPCSIWRKGLSVVSPALLRGELIGYEVRTAVATIGVRGTDFWGGYGLTENGLDVLMLEGKGVYVQTEAGTVELDKAGLGTTVVAGGAPSASKGLGRRQKVQRAVATITP